MQRCMNSQMALLGRFRHSRYFRFGWERTLVNRMPDECKIGIEVNPKVRAGNPIIRGTSRYPARARSRASCCQLVQQRLRLFQVECVEALVEPAVDRSEKIAGLPSLCLDSARGGLGRGLLAAQANGRFDFAQSSTLCRATIAYGYQHSTRCREAAPEPLVDTFLPQKTVRY